TLGLDDGCKVCATAPLENKRKSKIHRFRRFPQISARIISNNLRSSAKSAVVQCCYKKRCTSSASFRPIRYLAPRITKLIGTITSFGAPTLKRQVLRAFVAASSKRLSPVLFKI